MSLQNPNSPPPSNLVQDGQSIYDSQLRVLVEPEHSGEFVAIEPATGRYFLGKTATSALVSAVDTMPNSRFFLTRVGRDFAHKV